MIPRLYLGTRASPLALKQVEELVSMFPQADFKIVIFETPGDRDKRTPLSFVTGSDFFTRDIDDALLYGNIDCALHSSKDLPEILPKGLRVLVETPSISPFEALVSQGNKTLAQLPAVSRIGTSSVRRADTLKKLRPDCVVVDVRGTIEERLALIDSGTIDALIVAHAALVRLRCAHRAAEVFPLEVFGAHPKQGGLSLVVREDICEKVKSILLAQGRATGN